ncbi:MAG: alpha/beta hydrolase, partial [Cyanothece sp. SIO1E1]|nr:alpha/beta hydrolase [Cyanothece sp. SIO1E1]
WQIRSHGRVQIYTDEDNAALSLQVKDLSADAIARAYGITVLATSLGQLNAAGQVRFVGDTSNMALQWQVVNGTYPAAGKIAIADDTLILADAYMQLADGHVQATGKVAQGQWQATLEGTNIPLNQVGAPWPGRLTGEAQLAGDWGDLSLQTIQGEGQAQVQMATGVLTATGVMAQGQWQAQVEGEAIPLHYFSSGLAGHVQGSLQLAGDLDTLSLDATQARGNLQVSKQAIAFLNQPLAAAFHWDGDRLQIERATAPGLHIDGWLSAKANDFGMPAIQDLDLNVQLQDYDLASVSLPALFSQVPISGAVDFDGKIIGTSVSPQLTGQVEVDDLALQALKFGSQLSGDVSFNPNQGLSLRLAEGQAVAGNRLAGRFKYEQGAIALTDGEWQRGDRRYHLTGQLLPGAEPQFSGQLVTDAGQLQDIVHLFPGFNPLAMIDINQTEGWPEAALQWPDLTALTGTFAATVNLQGSEQTGLALNFDLKGQDWHWGPYQVKHVQVNQGHFNGEHFKFQPLQLQGVTHATAAGPERVFDTDLTVFGQLGGQQQSAQVQIEQLPSTLLSDWLEIPLDISGDLSAIATLGGSLDNPEVKGAVSLTDTNLYGVAIPEIEVEFSYDEAQLHLGSRSTPTIAAAEAANQAITETMSAERVIIHYGPFSPSFRMKDLATFVKTQQVPGTWKMYLGVTDVDAQNLWTFLTQGLNINFLFLDEFLNSPAGEHLLMELGQVIYTPSGQANVQALRSALIKSAMRDNHVSMLELLQNYPTAQIHIDGSNLVKMLKHPLIED